jgi:hypothetical protein
MCEWLPLTAFNEEQVSTKGNAAGGRKFLLLCGLPQNASTQGRTSISQDHALCGWWMT